MRMWLVDPKIMCRKHLLGEHVELHMLVGTIRKNKSITGYIEKDLIQPNMIRARHYDLVIEMEDRGYKHKSRLPIFIETLVHNYPHKEVYHELNIQKSLQELVRRCPDCRKRYKKSCQK